MTVPAQIEEEDLASMEDKVTENEEEVLNQQTVTTVAKLLVRCLENEGVKYVFGIPAKRTSIL